MAVTADDINESLDLLKERSSWTLTNEAYVQGKNPPILDKEQAKKPDNRIPVGLAKMAVDDMSGYAGRAGDKKVEYDLVDTETKDDNDPFVKYAREMDSFNESDIENSELYEESLTQGESYEIFWVSDDLSLSNGLLTTEYKIVPNIEVFLKYDNSIKKKLLYAIHFRSGETAKEDEITEATVYYPEYHEKWSRADGGSMWTEEALEKPDYPFTTVPVNVFKANRRSLPLFEAEKPLIDAHDEIISKTLNEVDRFNDLILLLGQRIDQKFAEEIKSGLVSIMDKLAENNEGGVMPAYLEKDLSGSNDFYNKYTDRIERLFHKSVKIPDMTDEAFAGQQSGIAIAFKLIGMEFKAAQIDTYFDKGLKARMGFYADVYNASTASVDIGDYKAIVDSKRNIPVDLKTQVEVAQMLTGLVSKETLLKFLPEKIVSDEEKELEKLDGETEPEPFSSGDDGDI
ncbi:MAG: phage portal protein [Deltaproteobacteria bacterium]|nr:phage portal protein [Deltaproteobacteria bacterium]